MLSILMYFERKLKNQKIYEENEWELMYIKIIDDI